MEDNKPFKSPVRSELVHKRSVSEVLLTDFVKITSEHFVARAQWPRWHVFYASVDGSPDSALMAETLRQAGIYLSHICGVPLTHQFLLPSMSLTVEETILDPSAPTPVVVELDLSNMQLRSGLVSAFTLSARFLVDGVTIGRGEAVARIVGRAVYERYRGKACIVPALSESDLLACHEVGHSTQRNVALGQSRVVNVWPLRVDPTHPIFFDHPLDHVPGMFLLEAARQAVRAASKRPDADFASLEAKFVKVAELGHSNEVSVVLPEPGDERQEVRVRITHDEDTLMTLVARVKDPSQPGLASESLAYPPNAELVIT